MIAANIGKIFLDAYNEKYKSNYSAKEFFVEKYYELFFNHNKYMMSAGNSPLENPKISWKKMGTGKMPYESVEKRISRFEKTIEKIETGPAEASIAMGFYTLDVNATTSGQVTNLNLPIKTEDIYLSWIGSGFGIGVQGGLSLLFAKKKILLDLYEGWQLYRNYLNKTPELRGNQINAWNGQWIAHKYDKRVFNPANPTALFTGFDSMKDGVMEVRSQSWTKIIVGIARTYPDINLTAYIYSLRKANITVGFIPFELPRIRQPYDLYEKYFNIKTEFAEQLFGTQLGFTKACQMGAIGVNALEPKGFKESLNKGIIPKYNLNNEEKKINFHTYQIWLLSMLNNEELWDKSLQIAKTLNDYSLSDKNAKKAKSQEVKNLLTSINKKQFIERLTSIIKGSNNSEPLISIAETVHSMPDDNVVYFFSLIKLQYEVVNKKIT